MKLKPANNKGLNPKPIDDGALTQRNDRANQDEAHPHRADSLHYFIYNTLPGTTSAAGAKAQFLKQIILGKVDG